MKGILIRKSDGLTAACRSYFELLKAWLQSGKRESFKINEVMKGLRMKETKVRRYHKSLISEGLLNYEKQEGTNTYHYRVKEHRDYQELKGKISGVLDGILENWKTPVNATIAPVSNRRTKDKEYQWFRYKKPPIQKTHTEAKIYPWPDQGT